MDHSIQEIIQPTTIISLKKDDSLKHALHVLAQHNILSAPVYDPQQPNKCLGLIDVLDMATFARETYYANNEESQFKNYLLQFSFDVEKVESVMDLSTKNPYIPTPVTATKKDVLEKFGSGLHRVPVVDENGKVIFILSQMYMFRHFFKNETTLYEPLKKKTVQELNLGSRGSYDSMFAVREDQLAIDAFKQIADNGVSAVGILDSNGKKLVGVLSASDLQGFLGEDFHSLGQTVLQFKTFAKEKKEQNTGAQNTLADPVVFCKLDTTLEDVVERIDQARIHRIFIMDDNMQMVGVVSLTDLFKLLAQSA